MGNLDYLREDFKHVRSIHFSVVIVSATIIYLTLSTWSDLPELRAELNKLQNRIDIIQTMHDSTITKNLSELFPRWVISQQNKIKSKLQNLLKNNKVFYNERGNQAAKKAFSAKTNPRYIISSDSSLKYLRACLDSISWNVITIDSLVINNSNLELWALNNEQFIKSLAFIEIENVTIISIPTKLKQGGVLITLLLYLDELRQTENVLPVLAPWKKFTLNWKPSNSILKFESNWFEKDYPLLTSRWNHLQNVTLEEAVKWAELEQYKPFDKNNPKIIGFEIEGKYIGYVGPMIIIVLMLYLISYITQIKKNIVSLLKEKENISIEIVSPWMGTMSNHWAKILTLFSTVIIPAFSVGLTMWRFLDTPSGIILISSITIAITGILIFKIGYEISNKCRQSH